MKNPLALANVLTPSPPRGLWKPRTTDVDLQTVRHLLLRFCLGFILVWFGTQQVISPDEWTGFIPEFIFSHSPTSGSGLILVHGLLLLLSGTGISFGVFPKSASLLAATLLLEIIVVLFLKGNSEGLIVRDVGLLGMAIVLTMDQFPVLPVKLPPWLRRDPQSK